MQSAGYRLRSAIERVPFLFILVTGLCKYGTTWNSFFLALSLFLLFIYVAMYLLLPQNLIIKSRCFTPLTIEKRVKYVLIFVTLFPFDSVFFVFS